MNDREGTETVRPSSTPPPLFLLFWRWELVKESEVVVSRVTGFRGQ